jgi:hypothetical protein
VKLAELTFNCVEEPVRYWRRWRHTGALFRV